MHKHLKGDLDNNIQIGKALDATNFKALVHLKKHNCK